MNKSSMITKIDGKIIFKKSSRIKKKSKSRKRKTSRFKSARLDENSDKEEEKEFKRFGMHKPQILKLDVSDKSKSYLYEESEIKNVVINDKTCHLDQEKEEIKVYRRYKPNEFSRISNDYMENILAIHDNSRSNFD